MKDSVGYALSGCDARAIDPYEQAVHAFRCLAGDPVALVDAALSASPELVMGHALRAWLYLLSTEAAAVEVARASLAAARALPHDRREGLHLLAIERLCAGRWHDAARVLEDLSAEWPLDALALQAGQQIDFFVGDSRMLRDRIARALPAWSPAVPGWHAVLGMYAFGLEETGDYASAERLGRRAVELEPRDAWAQHAVAHVLEMQERRDEGVDWMLGQSGWRDCGLLLVHNSWHLALHHLARGEADRALALYDGPVGAGSAAIELVDASSLLWRLELAGVDVGDRWGSLAARWAPHAGAGHYAFNDLHAAMAFARAGREDLLEAVREAQAEAAGRDDDNAGFTRDVGAPATEAFAAFARGDAARAVSLLRPIRSRAHRFGGSHAQRAVLDLTLLAAARRSPEHRALARALEAESSAMGDLRRGTLALRTSGTSRPSDARAASARADAA
ncbi:MAG TPA: tetratricopeptide repeat protein [Burkholderiaceae bacterium]|nr:tetratricopeptide repeat protein [Burkholderiaceae bacterium]